jgi:hypothetical protein
LVLLFVQLLNHLIQYEKANGVPMIKNNQDLNSPFDHSGLGGEETPKLISLASIFGGTSTY